MVLAPLVILLGIYPAIYYLTHPDIRYRHAIDTVIVMLIVYCLTPLPRFYGGIGNRLSPTFGRARTRASQTADVSRKFVSHYGTSSFLHAGQDATKSVIRFLGNWSPEIRTGALAHN